MENRREGSPTGNSDDARVAGSDDNKFAEILFNDEVHGANEEGSDDSSSSILQTARNLSSSFAVRITEVTEEERTDRVRLNIGHSSQQERREISFSTLQSPAINPTPVGVETTQEEYLTDKDPDEESVEGGSPFSVTAAPLLLPEARLAQRSLPDASSSAKDHTRHAEKTRFAGPLVGKSMGPDLENGSRQQQIKDADEEDPPMLNMSKQGGGNGKSRANSSARLRQPTSEETGETRKKRTPSPLPSKYESLLEQKIKQPKKDQVKDKKKEDLGAGEGSPLVSSHRGSTDSLPGGYGSISGDNAGGSGEQGDLESGSGLGEVHNDAVGKMVSGPEMVGMDLRGNLRSKSKTSWSKSFHLNKPGSLKGLVGLNEKASVAEFNLKNKTEKRESIENHIEQKITARRASVYGRKDKTFLTTNGYSWDVAFVFPRDVEHDEEHLHRLFHFKGGISTLSERVKKILTLADVVHRLESAGMETDSYLSAQEDEVVLVVRCAAAALEAYAERQGYPVPLDEGALARTAHWGGLRIPHKPEITPRRPYAGHYAPFSREEHMRPLYQKADHLTHPWKQTDRIKLIHNMIEDKEVCDIDVQALLHMKAALAFFPLHDAYHIERLSAEWLPPLFGAHSKWSSWLAFFRPHRQPLTAVRDYLGEKEGLYFAFLGHYTHWLSFLSIFGLVVMADCIGERSVESWATSYFCVFTAFWCVLMMEYWKRKEATLALEWGMVGFKATERDRPHFHGTLTASHVHGEAVLYYPPRLRSRAVLRSNAVMGALLLLVLGAVASVGVFRVLLAALEGPYGSVGKYGANVLNSVRIQVMNAAYTWLAISFTEKENHQTDTAFENSLVSKIILFQAVNSYATFFYISFLKAYLAECEFGSCMADLALSLGIIFSMEVGVNMASDILVPHFKAKWRRREELAGTEGKQLTPVEDEYIKMPYDKTMQNLKDFTKLIIQYGYVTMFVTAFPAAPIMAWWANCIKLRMDGYKLLHEHQRALPQGKEDIGIWQDALHTFGRVAVVTNAGLVCFTMSKFALSSDEQDYDDADLAVWSPSRIWYFVILQYVIYSILKLVMQIVPDVPEDVVIQLERNKHIQAKVIKNIQNINFPHHQTGRTDAGNSMLEQSFSPRQASPLLRREESAAPSSGVRSLRYPGYRDEETKHEPPV